MKRRSKIKTNTNHPAKSPGVYLYDRIPEIEPLSLKDWAAFQKAVAGAPKPDVFLYRAAQRWRDEIAYNACLWENEG